MPTGARVKLGKRHVQNGASKRLLNKRHPLKGGWKLLANSVPVPGAALNATNTVVVCKAEAIHERKLDAMAKQHAKTIGLRQTGINEGGTDVEVVGVYEAIEPTSLFSSEAKNVHVIRTLKTLTHCLLEKPSASGTTRTNEIASAQKHVVRAGAVLGICEVKNRNPKPSRHVIVKALRIGVFFRDVNRDNESARALTQVEPSGNGRGGTRRKPNNVTHHCPRCTG
jgi:hypothetical protein